MKTPINSVSIDDVRLNQCVKARWGTLRAFYGKLLEKEPALPWRYNGLRAHISQGKMPVLAARLASEILPANEWAYITKQRNDYTDPRSATAREAAPGGAP